MKRIAVIGAGISGLSVANILNHKYNVTVFEQGSAPGGLIRCEHLSDGLFHTCGGHVFNTKFDNVEKWFWGFFNREKDFKKATRNSIICHDNKTIVRYPIENHIYQLPSVVQESAYRDLHALACNQKPDICSNFKEFLLAHFGKTLCDFYFNPYNAKIWRQDLSTIPLSWLGGKLPMPSPSEILDANQNHKEETSFVHSSFWYAKNNGSQFIADTLAKGLTIRYDIKASEIRMTTNGRIFINGDPFDGAFFCGNIKDLAQMIPSKIPSLLSDKIKQLQYHGTTTAFCTIDKNPYSWIYLPSDQYTCHRIICTGNFATSNNTTDLLTGTVEFSDFISDDDIQNQLSQTPFAPKFIKSHYSQYTYPVQTASTRSIIQAIKDLLRPYNIFLVGRFAEWEYFNMDAAINSALIATAEFC